MCLLEDQRMRGETSYGGLMKLSSRASTGNGIVSVSSARKTPETRQRENHVTADLTVKAAQISQCHTRRLGIASTPLARSACGIAKSQPSETLASPPSGLMPCPAHRGGSSRNSERSVHSVRQWNGGGKGETQVQTPQRSNCYD